MGDTTAKTLDGFVSLSTYYDILRESLVGTATVALDPDIPFSYFGFVDFSEQSFWMENNLRVQIADWPLHASLQYVAASNLPEHLLRLGFVWKGQETPGLKDLLAKAGIFVFSMAVHLMELDTGIAVDRGADNFRRGGQIEPAIAGALPGTDGRLFYEAWLDLDFDWPKDGDFRVTPTSDILIGVNLVGNPGTSGMLGAVIEFRYNGHYARLRNEVPALEEDPGLNPFGLECGLRYFGAF